MKYSELPGLVRPVATKGNLAPPATYRRPRHVYFADGASRSHVPSRPFPLDRIFSAQTASRSFAMHHLMIPSAPCIQ